MFQPLFNQRSKIMESWKMPPMIIEGYLSQHPKQQSISSRGRTHKMSATMQQSVNQQDFFGFSYYMYASYIFPTDPQMLMIMQDIRQNSSYKTGYATQ